MAYKYGGRLMIASNNKGKIREIKAILNGIYDDVISMREAGIEHEVVEDGETFLANACKKAREISLLTDCDVLADDSGLMVDGLGGGPGVYSARYSGENATDEENNAKLVREVSELPEDRRGAKYVCVMALYNGGMELCTALGECHGVIVTEPAGENGFGYDPYFYLPDHGCTMAQLDPDVKNGLSHRGKALVELRRLMD